MAIACLPQSISTIAYANPVLEAWLGGAATIATPMPLVFKALLLAATANGTDLMRHVAGCRAACQADQHQEDGADCVPGKVQDTHQGAIPLVGIACLLRACHGTCALPLQRQGLCSTC